MGINVGDVVVDGDDIFGDGVNVAARLEGLSEPGGICISGRVQEDAQGRIDIAFDDAGEQQLKNIARPVRVYRARLEGASSQPPSALTLPDKPSIAVLPFQNMSGDHEQEYFVDGMVDDIITGLSRIKWLFVIARNSTFTYKGRAVDVKQVGRELGVRYVLKAACANWGIGCGSPGSSSTLQLERTYGLSATTANRTIFSPFRMKLRYLLWARLSRASVGPK